MLNDYSFLNKTRTAEKWKRFGAVRRAGVTVPLFSVWSKKSIGIGEIPDIKRIVKWCNKTGNSIIQLLPLNDAGFDFAPYNSVSSCATDPMYISIQSLKGVNLYPFKRQIHDLRQEFRNGADKVDYRIKTGKLRLLKKIYNRSYLNGLRKFRRFSESNDYWLKDYAMFKVLKELNSGKSWEEWDGELKDRNPEALIEFAKKHSDRMRFHYWIQWQLYEQLMSVKKYANERGVFIMGDIPYLVSRDSADVWSDRQYFRLDLSAGAPPDVYFANGQRWGMPPYNRAELEKSHYSYFCSKLKYAENFYDMYRIDHFVGFFRLWTIKTDEPKETGGLNGKYDPADEREWENSGRKMLDAITDCTDMLPCAEDLGTVPECSPRVLWDYGIPGTDVQRWMKERSNGYDFLPPWRYRWLSVSTVSTHDSSTVVDWWHNEAGTIDEMLFDRIISKKGIDASKIPGIKSRLFDLSRSHYNRLYWRKEIDSVHRLLETTGIPADYAWDLISFWKESYGEKEKFISFLNYSLEDVEEEIAADGLNRFSKPDIVPENNNSLSVEALKCIIKKAAGSDSIFSIQLLQEWLCLDENFLRVCEEKSYRINFPGVVNESNWTAVIPYSLETINSMQVNSVILGMVEETNRKPAQ